MAKMTSDEQLHADIIDELEWDAYVDATQIDVEVADGVVTLAGTVPSYARKLIAQTAAQAVSGVHDLVNRIDVKHVDASPDDGELRAIASQVWAWDALVPEEELTLSVSDGWVTLAGEVATQAQRAEAERAIGHLHGVRGVRNNIAIGQPPTTTTQVRKSIEEALRRRATHRASHIEITIDDDTVTLSGAAQSEHEKIAILGAVRHAPGIGALRHDLRVDPEI